MDEEQRSLLIRSFSHYSSSPGQELRYGVHGFVGEESVLRSACYRIGIVAALRSMKSKSVTGVVITACGAEKNGVRIVDPDGGALIADWEPVADSVANAADPDEFVTLIEELGKKENISFDGGQSAEVLLARDTSPTGEALLEAAKQGISSVAGTIVHDMGITTSPQLHWLVHSRNKGRNASEHDYLQHLSYCYRCLVNLIPEGTTTDKVGESLIVDGANSVSGDKIEALKDLCDGLAIEIRNSSNCALLDQGLGFDFIRDQKTVPSGFGSSDIGFRCASLDRDGDRLLYFSVLPSQEIEVVDGDKILFLFALFIKEQLTVLQEVESEKEVHYDARLVILQSDYENRESRNYLKSLGLDIVSFTAGTRSLHAVASQYDIGIYFEPDGRGGVLFSKNYLLWLEDKNNELLSSSEGSRKQLAVSRLLTVSRLMNTTVPDALASLLMVEAILKHNGWSLQKWNENYYDLANRKHSEVELADETAAATDDPKTVVISHSGTEEEDDTLIDEARSENANVSHLSQESEHIDEGPTESAEKAVNYEAQTGEQTDVDVSVELGQNQEQETITYVQPCENGTHAELAEGFQEKHESQSVPLHNDETSDAIKLEAREEEEDSQGHFVIESSPEEHEFDAEEAEDPEFVHDKEETEIKREVDDDTWVLVSDAKGDCLNPEPLNEKESYLSPESNGILESSFDAQTQSQKNSSIHLPDTTGYENLTVLDDSLAEAEEGGVISALESASDEPSGEKESCISPEVNGIDTQSENDDLLVSFDSKREEVGDNIGLERVPSVIVQDEQLETEAQNGSINVDSESNCTVNGPKLNAFNVPIDSGEALPIFSNGSITEEAGGPNSVEYASCTKASSEVNGIVVALTPYEHVAKVEAISDNGPIDIDANYLVNGKNSDIGINLSSSEVYSSNEPSTETLDNSSPDVDDTENARRTNDDGIILDSEAESGGFKAENGDANLSVAADGAGTLKQESEVNCGITISPVIEVTEPEVNSENDQAEEESKSESSIDNEETEMRNEFHTVSDDQPPSLANDSSLDVLETETVTVSDGTIPEVQVNSHDAQETYLESKAEDSSVTGDNISDCFVANSSNWEITIGSMQCVCPKSETPIMGSEEVCDDDSTSLNLGKGDFEYEVTVANNHCDQKAEETLPRESVAEKECDIDDRSGVNGTVHVVETNLDEESTSSLEESATAVVDGQSVPDEIVKKPFYYLIRTPKYDDEKLSEQIKLAEMLVEEKTIVRDAALAEYRHKKETCQKLRADHQAAVLEERAVRDLVRSKRKEIDSAQSLVNIAKDAMTIEDLDNKIANMERTIQHETVSLNEEKKLIREIKQSAKMREQLLATTKNQGFQQALNHKDKNEDQVKALRKELDALRISLSEKEQAVTAAVKILDAEHAILNELHRKLTLSNDVRQEAYSNLQSLRNQWSEKNKYFWTCKNAQRQANNYAASGDKTSLQSVCIDQVESVMELWNTDNEFRRDYIRCNLRSTLRRLGTPDGRSLGPDEEPPLLPITSARRIINPSVKDRNESREVASHKVVEQKKSDVVLQKPKKSISLKKEEEKAEASNSVKVEEEKEDVKAVKEQEDLKILKEQEELARKAEELRKIEEAEKLKEKRRLEEKAKFQEALERKKRKAEKAQAKAELRLKRQAEEKEKEKEKRAKKKVNKSGRLSEDTTSIPETETATEAVSEQPKEAETRERSVTLSKKAQKPQYGKQKKVKTILPPPPPLRNRGKRRTQQWWMWVAATAVALLILFFLGNLNFPGRVFSSWH